MRNNFNYWIGKDERAKQARKHTEEMQRVYGECGIPEAIKNTKVYDTNFSCQNSVPNKHCIISVEPLDTVQAAEKYSTYGTVALLNFASYKNPGGQFINGSSAQEECLCHASYLYNVLVTFQDSYYDWNNRHKNKALYKNRALYSPRIHFRRGESNFQCDVITCAAPNRSAAQKYQNVTDAENTAVLRERIRFVLDIAKDNNVQTLILGAYGCGVFGQNPTEVATIFKEYLATTHKCFDKVVFAIPKGPNLTAFEKVFKQ